MFLKKFTIFSIFVLLLVLFCFNTVSAEDNITSNPINTSDSSNILTDSINEHNSNIGVEDEVNLTAASKKIKTKLVTKKTTVSYNHAFYANITTSSNKKISNAAVVLKINNKTISTKSNKNGVCKFILTNILPKKYSCNLLFKGTKQYINCSKKLNITVTKLPSKIITKTNNIKLDPDTKTKLIFKLENSTNSSIVSQNITITLNNKTYTETNSKEGVTFETPLLPSGEYNCLIEYGGNKIYKACNKTIKITILKYPSTYSLYDKGLITSIKNQKETGICWAFATLAALESHLLLINNETLTKNEYIREGMESNFYDFSEADIAQIMSLNNTEGNGINRNSTDGGNFLYALAYLLNWYGPINETNPDNINSALKVWDYYPEHRIIEHHVQGIDIIPPRQNDTDNDKIKEAILKHGAISTDMVALGKYINKNTTSIHKNYYNYYTPWEDLPDMDVTRIDDPQYFNTYRKNHNMSRHAVAIIGWDDNYDKHNFKNSTRIKNNGAFLVKDSGLDKLWYVSYEDRTLAKLNESYVFVNVENNTNYKKQYYYDLYGTIGNQSSSNIHGCANCFTMDEDGFLSAFGFATYEDTNYTVNIFINKSINETSDYNMSGIVSGGYHTIKLPSPIEVHSGDNVIIAITYNTRVPLSWAYEDTNITKNLITKPGQAYYYNGEWHDLYPYNRDIVGCIRAYLT